MKHTDSYIIGSTKKLSTSPYGKLLTIQYFLFIFSSSVITYAQISPTPGRAAIVHSQFRKVDSAGIPNDTNALTSIQYFDGLGNPIQTVGYRQSPLKKDIVLNALVYDNNLRPVKNYLPFPLTSSTGSYTSSLQSNSVTFYGDNNPYQETVRFDNSPLNRPRETRDAGVAWEAENKTVKTTPYIQFSLKKIIPDDDGNLLFNETYYNSSNFWAETVEDEQGNVIIKAIDVNGKLIAVRDALEYSTSYVYDKRDRLTAVIQPEAYNFGNTLSKDSDVWQKYVFAYEYDLRNRVMRKHIPGSGWTEIVYDKADRPVMIQDPTQKILNLWTFHQYDAFGREVTSGEVQKVTTRSLAQALFDSQNSTFESRSGISYNNISFPPTLKPTSSDIKVFNYYDNYLFTDATFSFNPTGAFHTPKTNVKGLLTGIQKVNSRDNAKVYTDVFYYNDVNQIIQSQHTHQLSTNNLSNIIVKNFEYNFAGEVLKEDVSYPFETGSIAVKHENQYDHAGRVTRNKLGINSEPTDIIRYSYDEIGRLKEKKYFPNGVFGNAISTDIIYRPPSPSANTEDIAGHAVILEEGVDIIGDIDNYYVAEIDSSGNSSSGGFLQALNYVWHIRGGLLGVNLNSSLNPIPDTSQNDLFSYKLEYETAGQWAGNIGRQSWNHTNANNPVGVRDYLYTYDNGNRLKSASYSGLGTENYNIPSVNYDKNGNVTQLRRNGKRSSDFGEIDFLTYSYVGNRLMQVEDTHGAENNEVDFINRNSGTYDYSYYANGALQKDLNEGITNITYNTWLNQPEEITLTGGRWVKYTYDGAGALLKTEYNTGEIWEYADVFVFKNGNPYQISIPDGRAVPESGGWNCEFDYKDHLGNTRASFKAGPSGLVHSGKTDFDPWGVRLNGTGMENDYQNRWELQGKEKESTFNLNRINFGARTYNPTIGKWDRSDPMAEQAPGWTPYRYAFNNPLLYTDPTGLFESRREARQYARDNDISTGFFSKNKIEKGSDGTFAINSRSESSSTFRDANHGVMTGALVTGKRDGPSTSEIWNKATDPTTDADMMSLSVNAALGGGIGFQVSAVRINNGPDMGWHVYGTLNLNFGIGADAGFDYTRATNTSDAPYLEAGDFAGPGNNYSATVGAVGFGKGNATTDNRHSLSPIPSNQRYSTKSFGVGPGAGYYYQATRSSLWHSFKR